ncbi:hypothetical protein [Paenibacillus oceani]|uniref:Uncharacterized protein n=1 Tax=Paenibacillus oceani TaxID=2772510 RepID=A0A927GY02_9BACL|nr:hypothetical protein [Paenibacillus oceani]MBD2861080.1 hypothetical protein [Paenibacillus oceani]
MNWFTDYEAELRDVFRDAEQMIGGFPPPLHERGLAYLYKFHPYKEGSTKNYICYLLPFWLKELDRVNERTCRDMALAGVFVMLHFFVQDDCMDEPQTEMKQQLALASMFQLKFLEVYRKHFEVDSPFWKYFQKYMTEWATSVAQENNTDYFNNPVRIAHKASPVKLSSTGILIKSRGLQEIQRVSDRVDQVLITLQMSDDWADWEEDLQQQNQNANGLLTFIQYERQLMDKTQLNSNVVRTFLYVQCGLSRYAAAAANRHEILMKNDIGTPHLDDFHRYLVSGLLMDAVRIEDEKRRLLSGGFYHWMSKNA